ncbi:hypothetical protein [Actinoplanes sp. NPDC051859]|uniref:hypothetical protein n=1 Tax=Actinoplanes sp. NPDC051859 TaxID=3363909 RepID=UPI0037AC18E2
MGPGRNALAAVGLLVGLGLTVALPGIPAALLPEEGPALPGGRIDIGDGVALTLPAGARLDLGDARPGSGDVTFRTGAVTVKVATSAVPDRPAEFIAHARHKLDRDEDLRPGPAEPWPTTAGVQGERGDLAPAGCYFAAVAEGAGVVVTMPDTGCGSAPPEVWSAISSITFEEAAKW